MALVDENNHGQQAADARQQARSDQLTLLCFFLLIVGVFVGSFFVDWKHVNDPHFMVERGGEL
jgi:hypothetical protein